MGESGSSKAGQSPEVSRSGIVQDPEARQQAAWTGRVERRGGRSRIPWVLTT